MEHHASSQLDAVQAAVLDRTLSLFDDGTVICSAMTRAWDLAQDVMSLDKVSKSVGKSKEAAFFVKKTKSGAQCLGTTKLGEKILSALKTSPYEVRLYFPQHDFTPYAKSFMACAEALNLFQIAELIHVLRGKEIAASVDTLNEFVDALRKEVNGQEFKAELAKLRRTVNKNQRGLCIYINRLFAVFSKLLVIRIDLGYRKPGRVSSEIDASISFNVVRTHWAAMLKHLRKTFPHKQLAGFAYCLEYGLEKGHHIHVLLFLNGSDHQEDFLIGKMIGKHWDEVITQGAGVHWNCNANKGDYLHLGIGKIGHTDTQLIYNLKHRVAAYLTKADYYIRFIAPGHRRVFGKGNMPKLNETAVGRPRKKRLEMENSMHTHSL